MKSNLTSNPSIKKATIKTDLNSVEDYVKAASLLSFTNQKEEAITLLNDGLTHFPNDEEIIRAMFSFMCQDFNVIRALNFAEEHDDIFANDEYSNILKAIDLVRLSLNFDAPRVFTEKMVAEVDHLLYLFNEENTYDTALITVGLIEEFHLPLVGLGIAKHLADQGDDFAQMVIGGSYLKGYHVSKNLTKATHYLTLSADANNEKAKQLLNQATNKSDFS